MNDTWDTAVSAPEDIGKQPFWLARTTEKMLNAMRALGLPSESEAGRLALGVPTVQEQAIGMRPMESIPQLEAEMKDGVHFLAENGFKKSRYKVYKLNWTNEKELH